jgi:hypothetical protein
VEAIKGFLTAFEIVPFFRENREREEAGPAGRREGGNPNKNGQAFHSDSLLQI